ncbi:benzaldehyde dehydrogenase [Burkholderia cepacia]|uniref:benzaldehyde dehydrogenase n=1 Tax=Burkholderia cepacia TaxID=292 RepID=UPI000F5F2001|nr:benzaldehyde dehydrogenase [Burkholderia cepacia]MCA8028953.1 benzaldehyde dehydrogenase [Burkholderia cepacia]RRA20996.1 aldehyde dehydrogenase family protein [Burkholderia cepacia]
MNQTSCAKLLEKDIWQSHVYTGQWCDGSGESGVVEPATGKLLGSIGTADAAFVALSTATAHSAQPDWAGLPYDERAAIMRRAAQLAEAHSDEIIDWIVRESGSTRLKAGFELSITIKAIREAAALPSRSAGEVLPSVPGRLSLARRRPLGVVGVIAPFNFPLYLAMRAVAPALALGNAVVLKPDPRTSVSGGVVIARLFEVAGIPAGVLHMLPGDGNVGAALTSDPHVAMIQFTGSTAAGRKVGESAGRHLKKVSLELGGKNSLIVLDDADLDLAIANTAWGAYLHQGQICMSTGRVLVQRGIYQRFVDKLVAMASSLTVGDPSSGEVALGPLINAAQRDHVAKVVAAAQRAGAKLEIGGKYRDLFFEPTVLSCVDAENPAFHEEIFGPVAVVVPFDTDEEVIELANRTEYGLSTAIITSNVGRALAMGERLRTGLLHINDQTVNDEVVNPFGGVGASGNGTSIGGPANWEEFTQWQWLTVKGQAPFYAI